MNNFSERFIFFAFVLAFALYFFFEKPKVEIRTETRYLKGDTTEVLRIKNRLDSINYTFAAFVDSVSMIKHKKVYVRGKADTVILFDTLYVPFFYSKFDLGDSILGTSGKVEFYQKDSTFKFDSIHYRYPQITKTVVDTVKKMNEVIIEKPIWENHWFYSTIALLFLIIQKAF